MKLIADSGSTKTTWALLDRENCITTVQTSGMNPYFLSMERVHQILEAELMPFIDTERISEIHFYGAGCSTENNNRMLSVPMQKIFRNVVIHIYHDILGAARALFGKENGIACILGTGCNSCYYDGTDVESKVPSLGYFYGDEGAGSYLGKIFIGHYLKNRLPDYLKKEFDEQYHLTLEDILNSIYNRQSPNRWLASFSEFLAPRQQDQFIHRLVRDSFDAFIEEHICRYDGYKEMTVSFVGSIAHHYSAILKTASDHAGLKIGIILQSPIEGLQRYHTEV
jgi:glucosamine kinase